MRRLGRLLGWAMMRRLRVLWLVWVAWFGRLDRRCKANAGCKDGGSDLHDSIDS